MPVQREHSASQGAKKTASSQMAQVGQETLPVVVPPVASAPAAAPKTKSRRWMLAGGGVLVMGLAGLFYLQPWATPAPVVMVETVALGPVTRVLAVNGRIAGVRSVDVRPLVSGTLVEVLVAEGDIVTRNQALMQLDTATQQAVVRQAVAGLDAAFVAQDDAVATLARTRTLGANVARGS